MADDITISGINDDQNAGQSAGQWAGIASQGGAQPAANQGATQSAATPVVPVQNDQLPPVIDLSGADQTVPAQTQPAAQNSAATAPVQTASSTRRSKTIMLGDDDDASQPAAPQEKYAIPALVKEKFPDLIQLIKETESMNDEERDYWFQILPIMTEDQISKFRDILVNEKQQLASLDQEYEQELQKLNDKHMVEWKEFETREKRKTITSAEQASKAQEKAEEEDLLKRLSQV